VSVPELAAGVGAILWWSRRWGYPPFPKLAREGRLDYWTRQFAEPGDHEVKAGHDRELLLLRTVRGDKVGGENIRLERAFFGREWRCLART
jgi:hypothetical protein